jgi:hypothetical protein
VGGVGQSTAYGTTPTTYGSASAYGTGTSYGTQ